jgi:hypothetical protein
MPNLTDAELRLLSLLSWKTRAAADVQLASVLGVADSERPAFVRRLKQLARRGFLSRHCVSIALLVPEAPLVDWLPDLPEADWQAVAWKLQHRWNELSATRVWINVATSWEYHWQEYLLARTLEAGRRRGFSRHWLCEQKYSCQSMFLPISSSSQHVHHDETIPRKGLARCANRSAML